jgi:hypothetical protein
VSEQPPEQPTATPPEQDEQHPSGDEAVPGQPTAPDEQPAEPEPEAPESRLPLIQRDGDQAVRAFEREAKRHEAECRAIFGEQFVANLCPHCEGVGYLEQPPPKTHPDFRRCGTCNGYGRILTGALEGENAFAQCPHCGGRGYETRPQVAQQAQTVPPPNGNVGNDWERPSWMGDPQIAGPPPPQPTWNPPPGS